MKLKYSLFVELASFSSPLKLNFLFQAGSCLFYNSREEARPQRMCFLLVVQVLIQLKALGSASSFSHQPGTSTAPFRKATHSQLLYLELQRVSLSRQDLKCIKGNSCSELFRQQESHTDFPPTSLPLHLLNSSNKPLQENLLKLRPFPTVKKLNTIVPMLIFKNSNGRCVNNICPLQLLKLRYHSPP